MSYFHVLKGLQDILPPNICKLRGSLVIQMVSYRIQNKTYGTTVNAVLHLCDSSP